MSRRLNSMEVSAFSSTFTLPDFSQSHLYDNTTNPSFLSPSLPLHRFNAINHSFLKLHCVNSDSVPRTIEVSGAEAICAKFKGEEFVTDDSGGGGSAGGHGDGGDSSGGRGDNGGGDGEENDKEEEEFGPILKFEEVMKETEAKGVSLPSDMLEAAKTTGIRKMFLLRYLDLQVLFFFFFINCYFIRITFVS